ncbi:serine kinase [Rubellimicrobium rubrum]|uniref:Serine kinase n=1 Tax=Rubellimicrobium rubrum TaxID=2585369 RepID=A0A5C4MTY7_9RHOB|nr:HPr kinase/phosphatase C-terminal domain-containing protein [Rubellimicrobium rubrum]TNC49364.1 serine kinase [Rubellimicrobium rubrum]
MPGPLILHASTVAWRGRGILIRGASGSGKSALALDLMALGARLVADDRTELHAGDGAVVARCPAAIRGLIEARCVGLLKARTVEEALVALVVDLDQTEAQRLPPWRDVTLLGVPLPCLHKPATGHFAPAILQYVKAGRACPAPQRLT